MGQLFFVKILYIIIEARYNILMKNFLAQDKIKLFKEKLLERKAQTTYEKALSYHTNPITAKFAAFQKAKKEIEPKDLL